jgi:hypothetical protein
MFDRAEEGGAEGEPGGRIFLHFFEEFLKKA